MALQTETCRMFATAAAVDVVIEKVQKNKKIFFSFGQQYKSSFPFLSLKLHTSFSHTFAQMRTTCRHRFLSPLQLSLCVKAFASASARGTKVISCVWSAWCQWYHHYQHEKGDYCHYHYEVRALQTEEEKSRQTVSVAGNVRLHWFSSLQHCCCFTWLLTNSIAQRTLHALRTHTHTLNTLLCTA